MLSKQQVIDQLTSGQFRLSAFDGRDSARLAEYFTPSEIEKCGWELRDLIEYEGKEWNEETLLDEVRRDIDSAFTQALDKQLSALAMESVLIMWLWVFEIERPPLTYQCYGLPIAKFAAKHFGCKDPIPQWKGDEDRFEEFVD